MTTIYQYFCIKNEHFWNIFKSQFYQNIPHKRTKLQHLNIFFRGNMPPNPPPQQAPCYATRLMSLRGTQLAQIKKKCPPPHLVNPANTHSYNLLLLLHTMCKIVFLSIYIYILYIFTPLRFC